MRKIGSVLAALFLIGGPAKAAITYELVHGGSGPAFSLTVDDLITTQTTFAGSELINCRYGFRICTGATFYPITLGIIGNAERDIITLDFDLPNNGGSGTSRFDFADGVFSTLGEHIAESNSQVRLVVSSDAAAAVPEPATWAMVIMGFGLVGAASRRRSHMRVNFS